MSKVVLSGAWGSDVESKEQTVQKYNDKVHNPLSAIRAFCVQCMGGYLGEVDKCDSENSCALYVFRKGKNPYHRRSKKAGV